MMFHLCLVVIFVTILIADRWKRKKFMKLHHQLGNDFPYFPIIGNALKFMGNNEGKMRTFTQLYKQAWTRKHKASSIWIGNMFFVIEIWNRRRKILVPTFASRHVNNFIEVFGAQIKVAAELLESKVGKGNFSCLDYITPYTVDSVCESIFGVNVNVQKQPDHPFSRAFRECSKIVADRLCQPWLHFDFIYKLLPVYARWMSMTKIVHDFVDYLIFKNKALIDRRSNIVIGTDECKHAAKTFLELMIESSNDAYKGYSEQELREETLVLSVTGTDTTAVATSFALLLMSQHTHVQEKVYREIQENLPDSDKPFQFEDLLKLKYMKAVIRETLRLYPPIPIIMRYCHKDIKLPHDVTLLKDSNVIISIIGIQRNPEYWGEDSNEFNPDRFMIEEDMNSNAFMAFSYGPRNCVGQQYTMLSVTTALVTLLRRYRFTPATNFKYDKTHPLRLSFDVVLTHVDNFPVRIEYRY